MSCEASTRDRIQTRPANLDFLLRKRTEFLRHYLKPGDCVLEVGAGFGITSMYVKGIRLTSTDVKPAPWLDAVADIMQLPFTDGAFDSVVCLHVLHHTNHPRAGLGEMVRVLRPGGLLLVAEPHASLALRIVLALTGHEYIDGNIDPFGGGDCKTHDQSSSSGNNVIGDLLFEDMIRFQKVFPELQVEHQRLVECLTLVNSGGVQYRAPYLPLPWFLLDLMGRIDDWLAGFPSVFPMCREVVFRKSAVV